MRPPESRRLARLRGLSSTPPRAAATLAVIVCGAAAGYMLIAVPYFGPWIFNDELGYQKLAQAFGTTGHLALFDKRGISYSPLYPLVLSPLYALPLSGPTAYTWAKVVNCVLMASALVPIYAIARSVLPRGTALVAAALSALLPLML